MPDRYRYSCFAGCSRGDGGKQNVALRRRHKPGEGMFVDWAGAAHRKRTRDFWEVHEARYQIRGVILPSQMPVSRWHEQLGDPTVADGILDRRVHNARRVEMRGDSMRKNQEPWKAKHIATPLA